MDFIRQISYTYFLGFPVIFFVGIFTYLLLILTSLIMVLNQKRITRFPLKYHSRLAYLTILLATIHGLMSVSAYL